MMRMQTPAIIAMEWATASPAVTHISRQALTKLQKIASLLSTQPKKRAPPQARRGFPLIGMVSASLAMIHSFLPNPKCWSSRYSPSSSALSSNSSLDSPSTNSNAAAASSPLTRSDTRSCTLSVRSRARCAHPPSQRANRPTRTSLRRRGACSAFPW